MDQQEVMKKAFAEAQKKKSPKQLREEAKETIELGEERLSTLRKKRRLQERLIALVDAKYIPTEQYEARFEYQRDPEFFAVQKEIALLTSEAELKKIDDEIAMVERAISEQKQVLKENRG